MSKSYSEYDEVILTLMCNDLADCEIQIILTDSTIELTSGESIDWMDDKFDKLCEMIYDFNGHDVGDHITSIEVQ